MEPLWQLLEDRRSIAGVEAEWRSWLGDGLSQMKRWRRRREQVARSMPTAGWQRRRIVDLDDDTIVAIDDETGDEVVLAEDDRVVHEFDLDRLTGDMAAVLDLDGRSENIERGLHRLGVHLGVAGMVTPMFFAVTESPDALLALASRCAARESGPFAFITPTARMWREPLRALLRSRRSMLLQVGQLLSIGEAGLVAIASLDSLVAAPARTTRTEAKAAPRFPTPPRSTWRDVRIKFVDGETVSIKVGAVSQVLNYTEMGFAHPRSKKPTVLWILLRNLAIANGALDWKSHGSSRKVVKNMERLSNLLREILSITGDPIPYDTKAKTYRAAFEILPD